MATNNRAPSPCCWLLASNLQTLDSGQGVVCWKSVKLMFKSENSLQLPRHHHQLERECYGEAVGVVVEYLDNLVGATTFVSR